MRPSGGLRRPQPRVRSSDGDVWAAAMHGQASLSCEPGVHLAADHLWWLERCVLPGMPDRWSAVREWRDLRPCGRWNDGGVRPAGDRTSRRSVYCNLDVDNDGMRDWIQVCARRHELRLQGSMFGVGWNARVQRRKVFRRRLRLRRRARTDRAALRRGQLGQTVRRRRYALARHLRGFWQRRDLLQALSCERSERLSER